MPSRHVPIRPDLDQLKHQAKDLLRAFRKGDPDAVEDFQKHAPHTANAAEAKLADAQFVLARSYGVSSWPRLVLACKLIDAIWRDDLKEVREMVRKHPNLITENARGTEHCNWGPPMSYAANLPRDRVIALLRELGATDLEHALGRAVLGGRIETARKLIELGAKVPPGEIMGPAETQSSKGMEFLIELGAPLCDEKGDYLAPVAMLLETYSRNPKGKHRCLELFAQHGIDYPDTPIMALHRGRLDLLKAHVQHDPGLLSRTFTLREIYPLEMGCHEDVTCGLHGTPLAGSTLLHMCTDFGETEIAEWLLAQGMDVNVHAEVDPEGFGGHTALFNSIVSELHCNRVDIDFTRLLLDHGADLAIRVNLRKRIIGADDETMHEYFDVTPLSWGEQFHDRSFVSKAAIKLLEERGGVR